MHKTAAYAPGHITGIFYITDSDEDSMKKGSLGAGFSIVPGVTTSVSTMDENSGPPLFLLNDAKGLDLPVSSLLYRYFIQSLPKKPHRPLLIEHRIEAPQGSGFGTSGAGALSLALALNKYFDFPFEKKRASQFAHLVEVECKTGLGTVIGEYFGGFEIRTVSGAPGIGRIESVPYPGGLKAVFAVRGPSLTSKALSDPDVRARVNLAGRDNLSRLKNNPDIENFLYFSRRFSAQTGLMTPWVESVLEVLEKKGIIGSMLMFGEAVFTLVDSSEALPLTEMLSTLYAHSETGREINIFSADINSTGGIYL